MELIRSVAWLQVENNRVLCVRTKGKDKFYIPGGKIDQGESPETALQREIKEELNITLLKDSICPAITIVATAHGFGSGTKVEMQCFYAQYVGTISANSEIEEIKWIGSEYVDICAPAAQQAIEFLAKSNDITKF